MKFSINKNILLEQLSNVTRAISPKNIIPILNGIKFDLTSDGLSLIGSDSDLTIKAFISKDKIKKIEEEGSIIIQSKYILDIIKNMPEDIINFEVKDGLKIMIYTKSCEFNLNCLNSLDYPEISLDDNKIFTVIKSDILKKMIRQTIFAISTQESRPLLTGINLKINGNVLECVATDSYRLAKKTIMLDTPYEEDVDIVIPGRNINELDKILSSDEKDVELHIFNNKILFKYDNILFQSNLLNGSYPNTSSFIPKEFEHIINTKLNLFHSSIDRAALLTQNKEKNIVKLEAKEKELCISSFASEIGKVEDHIEITKNNKEEISISFSAKYMLDALRTFEDDEINIMINTDSKPIVLNSPKDDTLIQLILPIKTY